MNPWLEKLNEAIQNPWILFGFLGQGLFFSRWIIQWYASEKRKESYVPLAFWYVSLAGACMIMVYALKQVDPVFMLGQMIGILNYSRNIWLIHGKERREAAL